MGGKEHDGVRYPKRIADQATTGTPGKASSAGSLTSGHGPHTQPSPLARFATGNDFVDRGPACDGAPPGTDGCVLDAGQRARVIVAYHSRIGAAQDAFTGAIAALRVDELMRAEPSQAPWLADILLDVIGLVASHTVQRIAKTIAAGSGAAIADAVAADAGAVAQAAPAASVEVGIALGAIIPRAKAQAMLRLPVAGASREKTASVAYLDLLGDAASEIYRQLREDMIAGVSDASLLMLMAAFQPSNGHTISAYKSELSGKLARFKSTAIDTLGVAKQQPDGAPWAIDHETKAFWVRTPIGRRLALYKRQKNQLGDRVPDTAGWREQSPAELIAERLRDYADHPYQLHEYVPAEFVDVTVQMHTAIWHEPPGEHTAGIDEIARMGDRR